MVKAITLIALVSMQAAIARPSDLKGLSEAVRILKPQLSSTQATSLALGAYVAAKQYKVDPLLLLSIAFQESSFRSGLPKGPAGELGICQVISSWASNPLFIKEFGHVTEESFRIPFNSFKYAAWILHMASKERGSSELPSWTLFNARAKAPRLRYYMKVSRHMVAMSSGGLQ